MRARNRVSGAVAGLLLIILSTGCSGVGTPSSHGTPPASAHVFLVVEENHSYSQVIGNPSMPYLNSLAAKFGLATQYYADVHPSIGNYFMLTCGQVETLDDSFGGIVKDDNIVRELVKVNKTWRSYAESLPSSGYLGGDVYPYFRHHNPFTYFSDVQGTSQAGNVVPFSQFSSDLSGGTLPDFSFIVPNALNDAHDGTLAAADQWLNTNIAPLIASSAIQDGGLLIIVFDESADDNTHGGGRIAWVAMSPKFSIKKHQSTTLYQHENTLRLMLEGLGLTKFPGKAATSNNMSEFFRSGTPEP